MLWGVVQSNQVIHSYELNFLPKRPSSSSLGKVESGESQRSGVLCQFSGHKYRLTREYIFDAQQPRWFMHICESKKRAWLLVFQVTSTDPRSSIQVQPKHTSLLMSCRWVFSWSWFSTSWVLTPLRLSPGLLEIHGQFFDFPSRLGKVEEVWSFEIYVPV